MAVVTVEEVSGRAAFKRFLELPYMLHREEFRWSPPLIAYDRWRLDPHRNPFFDEGDAVYLLARRHGKPSGRLTAQVAHDGDESGWFGFYDIVDDEESAAALLAEAGRWLEGKGCTSITGPASLTLDDEAGVLVDGFDVAGTTGRPWQPPWYATHLVAAGLSAVDGEDRRTWRLSAIAGDPIEPADDLERPALAGPHADPRLLVRSVSGSIVAVPDLGIARNSPLQLAKRARRRDWEGCTVVSCNGDPSALVPLVQRAAGAAGYRWVIAPWSPDPKAKPETVHRIFSAVLDPVAS